MQSNLDSSGNRGLSGVTSTALTTDELCQIIGELYISRAKIDQLYKHMLQQVMEMSQVITDLRSQMILMQRETNGELVKSNHND